MSGIPPLTPSAAYEMISVHDAQEIVLKHCEVLPSKTIPLSESLGCVAAEDVLASDPLPPFPASIKDGYAVRSEDGVGEYPSGPSILAGSSERSQLQPGTVHYITTDTIFLGERDGKDYIDILKPASPGQDIRPIGSDIELNAQVIGKGDTIGVAEMGLLATVGQHTVNIIEKPKVAVMSTGDELLEFDAAHPLPFGRIRDANRPMLLAACRSLGVDTVDLGIADDSQEQIESKIKEAMDKGAHVIICSGGVSMGDKDAVRPVLEKMGTIHFGKIKMKPGKPALFFTNASPRVLFFGLPDDRCRDALHDCIRIPARRIPCIMTHRGCYVRLQREYKTLLREPVDNVTALPSPTNLLEWHFVIEGAKGTDYEGGYYHGKILYTTDYPFRPPSIVLITPNGRFATNMKICMSMTDYHPESWNPVWNVGTILVGLLSFLHDTQATTGSITSAAKKKRELARGSLEFNVKNPTFRKLFPDFVKKFEMQKRAELMNLGKDPETVKEELEKFKKERDAEPQLLPWDNPFGWMMSISLFAVVMTMVGIISVPYLAN